MSNSIAKVTFSAQILHGRAWALNPWHLPGRLTLAGQLVLVGGGGLQVGGAVVRLVGAVGFVERGTKLRASLG